jgi:omega-amidase
MSQLTITTIQSNLHWENKAANLQQFATKINSIAEPTQLVILPEMFSTGFSMQPHLFAESMEGTTVQWMKEMAIAKKIILTGSIIIEENGNYHNRLIWMQPNGQYYHYDKRHLFAYANEDKHYTAGNNRLIVSASGFKILVQICYDLRFPVWARQQSQNGAAEYDIILYVANWPQQRIAAWKTMLTARAIENQAFVVGVNRVGVDGNNIPHNGASTILNALGEVLYQKEDLEDITTITLLKTELETIRNKFPFAMDADAFEIK